MLCPSPSRRSSPRPSRAPLRGRRQWECRKFKSSRSQPSPRKSPLCPSKTPSETASTATNLGRCVQGNQQYSVTALTDTTATISERYAYDAYGKLSVFDGGGTVLSASAYGNRYAYTGREWDEELGLYFFRARMYSPDTGRFVSRDPIGYVDGTSLYRNNFLLTLLDPIGSIAFTIAGIDSDGNFIFRPSDGGRCYQQGPDGRRRFVTCPLERPRAPGEPSFEQGLSSIGAGIALLQRACKGCRDCSCTEADCNSEAMAIGRALASAWQANYGHGPHDGAVPVAGWFCYDWTEIFRSAVERVRSKCFSTTIGAHRNGGGENFEIHVWLIITAGDEDPDGFPTSSCSVSFDDGYATGQTVSHPGVDLRGSRWNRRHWMAT